MGQLPAWQGRVQDTRRGSFDPCALGSVYIPQATGDAVKTLTDDDINNVVHAFASLN